MLNDLFYDPVDICNRCCGHGGGNWVQCDRFYHKAYRCYFGHIVAPNRMVRLEQLEK